MEKSIFFIAVDVDDKAFHGCGFNRGTGEIREFSCRPSAGQLAKKLEEFLSDAVEIRVCYEATYLGFSLQRDLAKRGYHCVVIAPSLIPERVGKRVKTDRLDCRKMAEYYANGQLTEVHIPDEEEEMVRDLVRTRKFLTKQMSALKLFILSTCRRIDWNYHGGENAGKKNWTNLHRDWLTKKIKEERIGAVGMNMTTLLQQLDQMAERIGLYNEEIERYAGNEKYRERVAALCCYRGIEVLTAMTLITELGDIKRFRHPRQLCSYAGMELMEYSSGGHERRYRMSKMGNRHVRTSVIEACQLASRVPQVSKFLRARRKKIKLEYVEIADRCMNRLYKKSQRMLHKNKIANKVKVACAREMLCFVWESLNAVAA
jgi:transposase